jgi:hypothetical protein
MAKNFKEFFKDLLRPLHYQIEYWRIRGAYFLKRNKIKNAKDIPIVINNFNRLSFLKRLIASLEKRGLTNIFILDNNSTYPPLLAYYKTLPYEVLHLGANVGHKAIWDSGVYKRFYHDYYVYTDSDVEIIEECPSDFLQTFLEEMQCNPRVNKIGLGLKIDDLPDYYQNKPITLAWEKQYREKPVKGLFYEADVDTTFALYRPLLTHAANRFLLMYRSEYPYEIRHLPWYVDSKNLSEEELFYINNAKTSTHWTKISL